VNMIKRNFMRLLMMGVFSRVCSGVLGGMRESAVSDSGRGNWFFFWDQIYVCMFCIMSYIIISSLCSGGFADATECM
jgi:hypothetical protein